MIKFKVLKLFSSRKMIFFKFFLQIDCLRLSFVNSKTMRTIAFNEILRVSAKHFVSF